MGQVADSVRHNVQRLATFEGRDDRVQFWPWAGCVIGAHLLLGNAAGFVAILAADGDPAPFLAVTGVFTVATVVLLAASITRRLHDRGLRGWWALVPLALVVAGAAVMVPMFLSGTPPEAPRVVVAFAVNGVYFVALAALLFQLVLPSRD